MRGLVLEIWSVGAKYKVGNGKLSLPAEIESIIILDYENSFNLINKNILYKNIVLIKAIDNKH